MLVDHVGGGLGSDFLLTDGEVIDADVDFGGAVVLAAGGGKEAGDCYDYSV